MLVGSRKATSGPVAEVQRRIASQRKTRRCLGCDAEFLSQHNGVRFCATCRRDAGIWSDLPKPEDGYRGMV